MGAYQGLGYKKGVVFIPQQLTLFAQHVGDDSHTLPDGSTTTDYILTRSLLPSANEGSVDSLSASVTATSETLVINRRFYWWEDLIGDAYLMGDFFAKARLAIAGDGSNDIYLTKVAFDVEMINKSGCHEVIATKTITFSTPPHTSSTTESSVVVAGLVKAGSIVRFRMYNDLSLRIRAWGYVAGGSGTMKLYFAPGSDDTYLVVNYAEG